MKCEICHRAEAVTAVTLTVDGQQKELYVCAACAKASRGETPRRKPPRGPAPKITIVGDAPGNMKPIVEEFFKATLDIMTGAVDSEDAPERICPSCHRTWESVKDSGKLGCPACWKAFAREIREEYLRGEYGPAHLGAAPSVETIPDARDVRAVLARDLKDAIAREDYRLAAELKRKLDALGDGQEDA